ncbi:hypothetical protein Bbelb_359640 [Branchiostoma belcheri]|nr:hypothetical protein Bbelb_359640 [Branchiostoma belcheri]
MGSPVSPIVCNLYMEHLEQLAINTAPHPHFGVIQEDGSLQIRIYRKPTHTDQYLNFDSNHPLDHKLGVIRTLFHRANTIVSDPQDLETEKSHLTQALKTCGFPQWAINKATCPKPPNTKPSAGTKSKGLVVLPYIKDLSEALRRIFISHGIATCFKPTTTLRHILVAPNDKTPKEKKCGVIYHIPCQGKNNRGPCQETYIGETERSLKARFQEHTRPSSASSEVSQHIHIESPGHHVSLDTVRILDTEQDYFLRGVKEAIYIRAHHPTLNRDGGRHRLPDTFDPVLTSHFKEATAPRGVYLSRSQSACVVQWDVPKTPNGTIIKYTIYLTAMWIDAPPGAQAVEYSQENFNPYTRMGTFPLRFLTPNSWYKFNMTASTYAGPGEFSSYTASMCEVPPGKPITPSPPAMPQTADVIKHNGYPITLSQVSERTGPVECYHVLVVEMTDDMSLRTLPDVDQLKVLSQQEAASSGNNVTAYVAKAFKRDAFVEDVFLGDGRKTSCAGTGRRKREQSVEDIYDEVYTNSPLKPATRYTVVHRVYGNRPQDGSQPLYSSSGYSLPIMTAPSPGNNWMLILIILCSAVIVLIILTVLILLIRRRKQRPPRHVREDISDVEEFSDTPFIPDQTGLRLQEATRTADVTERDPASTRHHGEHHGSKPTIMENYRPLPLKTMAISDRELTWDDISLTSKLLGTGNFGEVRKGTVNLDGDRVPSAIKVLKRGADEAARQDFQQEVDIMRHVGYHPYIINLLGTCDHQGQQYMALEMAGNGDLKKYLRTSRVLETTTPAYGNIRQTVGTVSTLSPVQLLRIACDVATGMEHLSSKDVIHRDLAARNVLLTDSLIAKVADFGLSRGDGIYEQTSQRAVPFRSTALEALSSRIYTTQSDVYQMMLQCWQRRPEDRPTFSDLVEQLKNMMEDKSVKLRQH